MASLFDRTTKIADQYKRGLLTKFEMEVALAIAFEDFNQGRIALA